MKILHLISQYPSKTGSGIYLTQVYKNFDKKGYSQKVLCCMNKDDMIDVPFSDVEVIEFNGGDIDFPVVGMSDIMPYNSFLFSELKGEKLDKYIELLKNKIKKVVNEFSPDIIFTNHLYIISSIVAQLELNCKVFAFCHGTCLRQLYKNSLHKDFVKRGIEKLDGIFALSEKQKNEIKQVFNYSIDRIYVIGGGYDLEFYYNNSKKIYDNNSLIKIIYAGKFSRSKGVLYLLKAFEKIKDKYNVKLILAGGGTGEEYDEIISVSSTMKDSIEIKGYMSMKEIGDLFRSCDIFAMPSFYEGLSLVTIEAMACGLKIVTNELENLIDFVGDEIVNSDVMQIVSMPKLYDTDKIVESEVSQHILNWTKALSLQIENLLSNRSEFDIEKEIKKFSWKEIVNNIETEVFK
ncbi:MAG: glycosyltransferase family 4 protein [Peptoniphilaceae bacterium]|uniref:glycosyltransferase family 4 protein n=1 Tax=Parvimonas sp. TaxID=1944660 RepID=UPI0025EF82E7|nr:glycosyltransferase family 4 protein [Parvimonas sp.]MCI5998028.1 glycosyltransferase family 4 protein [Parvimonas sp.]MDD7764962.1 glycosyltransferase family 4 protein [Peptoniphilaceae bacterium]MDY3050354.1 glycosyltransferase family 4 protein [Parvimonas sp.]